MRKTLRSFQWIFERSMIFIMLLLFVSSAYALWDNQQVYMDAREVQLKLLQLKPNEDSSKGPDFSQLEEVNSDICAWISLNGTNIDQPVLQGKSNLTYMNKDVFGNFSITGSIFMDTRNQKDFSDTYTLIYGHHVEEHLMFGDLDLYKDPKFFKENNSAVIMIPNRVIGLEVLAVLEATEGTTELFDPTYWKDDLSELGEYVKNHSININDLVLKKLMENPKTTQAVALATCSNGSTGNRTVLILITDKEVKDDDDPGISDDDKDPSHEDIDPPAKTGDTIVNSIKFWEVVILISAVLLGIVMFYEHRKNNED